MQKGAMFEKLVEARDVLCEIADTYQVDSNLDFTSAIIDVSRLEVFAKNIGSMAETTCIVSGYSLWRKDILEVRITTFGSNTTADVTLFVPNWMYESTPLLELLTMDTRQPEVANKEESDDHILEYSQYLTERGYVVLSNPVRK